MTGRGRSSTIEALLVTAILVFFTAAIFSLTTSGSSTYEKISSNKTELGRARVCISYINVKIRQNDVSDNIFVDDDGVLIIRHTGDLDGMTTYIFYDGGILWECFIEDSADPDIDLAIKISKVEDLDISASDDGRMIFVNAVYSKGDEKASLKSTVTLRTGEGTG
jgi:hypothetical protein